jgi:hypothetical protein
MSGNDHAIRSDALARSHQELVSDMQLRDVHHVSPLGVSNVTSDGASS